MLDVRRSEADDYYAGLTPAEASADEGSVMRQAFAGLLWSKQFYHYDVARWLDVTNGHDTRDPLSLPRVAGWEARLGTLTDDVALLAVQVP